MIYLDNAATTPVKKEVLDAMLPYFTEKWFNPSSLYNKATEISKDIKSARDTIGRFIKANGEEIFFTSGGSESNCWAIEGFVNYCRSKSKTPPAIITSKIEHKSILLCVETIKRIGDASIYYVGVDKNGFIDLDSLNNILNVASHINGSNILVSIQFANNEIGTIQHIKEIADLVHSYGAVFHTDAVQAFGQIPIDVNELHIDMLSASGHKIHAPKGIGILYVRNGIKINPLIYGTQMDGMRGGTENVPYIMGMAKAVQLCDLSFPAQISKINIRNYFIAKLLRIGCKLNGDGIYDINRLPNNINVTFSQNITGEALIYMLDTGGIIISSGSACNSHTNEPSYVLKEIGVPEEEIYKSVRFTLTEDLTDSEVDEVMCQIKKAIKVITDV